MRTAVWCPGDGQGHVTRAVAAGFTLGWDPTSVELLVGDPGRVDRRVSGRHPLDRAALPLPPLDQLWIDALPCGRGELTATALRGVGTVHHLARRLDWTRYRRLLPPEPPRFGRVLVTEALPDEQRGWLESRAEEVHDVVLRDPPAAPSAASLADLVRGSWLVVHAGPPAEVEELVATARDAARIEGARPRLVVIGTGGHDVVPAWPLLGLAGRLFTGGGANTIRQLRLYAAGVRHTGVPFPRRHDDQAGRLRWHRATPVDQ